MDLPRLIAHRGALRVAPENTLAALRAAKEQGAQWVEFDVMLSRDGIPVVIHDTDVSRTTNGEGRVASLSLSVLHQLDAGAWFSEDFTGEKIPTLDEYIACAASLSLGVNIEMKVRSRAAAKWLAKEVQRVLARYWPADLPTPLISSLSPHCLAAMRVLSDDYLLGYICDRWSVRSMTVAKRYDCVSMHFNYRVLSAERIVEVKAHGFLVLAYTVDQVAIAASLFDRGVSSVFTNDLLTLGEYL